MPRPTKGIKRKERITIRYTNTEMKYINKITSDARLSVTEYIRDRSLNYKIRPRLTEEQTRIYLQLAGMANNLNQLAKAANSREIFVGEILKALEQINLAIAKLI
jgi:outer membrane receptor for Fe3+-dicitrate